MSCDRDPIFIVGQHRPMKVMRPIRDSAVASNRGAKKENMTHDVRRAQATPGDSIQPRIKTDDAIRAEIAMPRFVVRRAAHNFCCPAGVEIQKLHRVAVR